MPYLLIKDSNRQVPFSSGMTIQREEMRCMLMFKTLDKGSIVKSNGRMLVVSETNNGKYRLENLNKGKKEQSYSPSPNKGKEENRLSPRQLEVVYLMSIDQSPKQIALTMGISRGTVSFYVCNAKKSMGKSTNTGLVAAAIRKGII